VARRRNPARLVIALSVAAVLAVFLIITAFASGSTPQVQPSELPEHDGTVNLGGVVVGPVTGDARGEGLRFELQDVKGSETVPVVYTGSVPDLFRPGREIMLRGQAEGGTFVAEPDSLVTKCPSKYAPSDS
jgi:cytochrome c-type biogenesis protein CcmE